MQQIILKTYQDQPIHFDLSDEIMINFTEMCKPFGKRPNDFLLLKQTKVFLRELSKSLNIQTTSENGSEENQLIITINGGEHPGTWIHRKVAIKAAAWLSPAFEVWMIEQIETLLTQGSVTLSNNNILKQHLTDFMQMVQQQYLQIDQRINAIETQLHNMACMKNTQSLDIFALDLAQYIEHTCGRLYDQGVLTQAQLKEIKHALKIEIKSHFNVLEYIVKQREYKKTYKMIAEDLQQKNIPTPSGKGTWNADRVSRYLKKYR